jgi:hypothetical protein
MGLFSLFPSWGILLKKPICQLFANFRNPLNPGGRLFLLCFSDATPGMEGPRRVSQSGLRHAFADGWEIESIEPVRLEIRPEYRQQGAFSGEDPRGWFLIARRVA